jgi:hypothetical protein
MELDSKRKRCAESYEYQPIEGNRSTRLLFLVPGEFDEDIYFRLVHVSLDNNPQYEALSYAWGNVSVTCDIYHEDDRRLSIGQSMRSISSTPSLIPNQDDVAS